MTFDNEALKAALLALVNKVLPHTTDSTSAYFAPGIVFGVTNSTETVYLEASGVANIETNAPITTDSVFSLYSTTKAITVTGALQLVERGLLELDAPAKRYLPSLAEIKVHKGVDKTGEIIWSAPKSDITVRQLITHTAGFSYTFFSQEYADVQKKKGGLNIFKPGKEIFDNAFLINEPGAKWHYGLNIDFVGKTIEAVTNQSLGEYLSKNIFEPAQLHSLTFHLKPDVEPVSLHYLDGGNVVLNSFQPVKDPEVDLGGSGLFGTVGDYLKFIRIWLNKGKADNGTQILSEKTIALALEKQVPETEALIAFENEISNDVPKNDSNPDSWSLPFSINTSDTPTGRPRGTYHWAGIANLYYWIDYKNGIGGFYASQIYPFFNSTVKNFVDLETAVYDSLR